MSVPDPITELRDLLQADAALTEIVGDRVYGASLPDGIEMPQTAVVLSPAGGPGRRGYVKFRRTRIDTTCYGRTLHESWLVHVAVREVLENLRPAGSMWWAELTSDGASALDPVEQWPTCYASYLVMSATVS